MSTEPTALIEERVDSKLRELLAGYQPHYTPGSSNRDQIGKRYSIHLRSPLPEYDTLGGKAYEANDNANAARQIYAMVLNNNYNYRNKTIDAFIGSQHPNVLSILDTATVHCSPFNTSHKVVIIDKPAGQRLSDIVAVKRITHEHVIKDLILTPLSKVTSFLHSKQIVHGKINLNNIYISDVLQLGEGVSEPKGLGQHYLYEPLERIMVDDIAKTGGNSQSDVYATAVLVYELIYGLNHLKRIPKDELIRMALNQGLYSLFANNIDFPDGLIDFFRGCLNNNVTERWGIEQFSQWMDGKRFNMISPAPAREAVRPISFKGDEFYSQRTLAHSLHKNWREALKEIRHLKLDRWAEMSLHKPDISETIARVMRAAGTESQATEKQNNEMLTRILCILDPVGPMRTMRISVMPDAMGHMLLECIRLGMNTELQHLTNLIEQDVANFWNELSSTGKTNENSTYIWRLQNTRTLLRFPRIGFGLERVIYDLNPSLPCQSPLLLPYHVTSLEELLLTLDALAKNLAPDTSLLDRHIAAFIASKLSLSKEIQLHDVASIPELANDQELIMVRLLAKAQQKGHKIPLTGLCAWIGMRMEKMIDNIHNRAFRKRMKLQLKGAASAGYVNEMFLIIANREIAIRDYEGFQHATHLYNVNEHRIDQLRNPVVVEKLSNDLGGRISSVLAYIILCITMYFVMSDYLGW